jgi:site-specific DNA-cytosine methylase
MKWAGHVTQMGLFSLAAKNVTGIDPVVISSYDGFEEQDNLLINYTNWNYKKYKLQEVEFKEEIDIVVTNPPCSGLSNMTSSKYVSKDEKLEKIHLIKKITSDAIKMYRPKVLIGENSSNLYTSSGSEITNDLLELCNEFGYSMVYYNTDAFLHGAPQYRKRTIYFLVKGEYVPVIPLIKKDPVHYEDVLKSTRTTPESDMIIAPSLCNNYIYEYMKKNNFDIRKELLNSDCYEWVKRNNKSDEILNFYKNEPESVNYKKSKKLFDKLESGDGMWHNFPMVISNTTPPIISKTLRRLLHPTEDRSLNIREAMTLMGFPSDFSFPKKSKYKLITKNVPIELGEDMIKVAIDFISGNITSVKSNFLKIDNTRGSKEDSFCIDEW